MYKGVILREIQAIQNTQERQLCTKIHSLNYLFLSFKFLILV